MTRPRTLTLVATHDRSGARRPLIAALAAAVMLLTTVAAGPAFAAGEDVPNTADKAFHRYWGQKRAINVIQKRQFLKESRTEIAFISAIVPNDEFWLYFPIGGSLSYFLTETVGLEANGAYILRSNSDLKNFLTTPVEAGGAGVDVTLPQALRWRGGLNGLWTPFHGKIGGFTTKLIHFDLGMIFGVGVIGTTVTSAAGEQTGKIDINGNLGAGFRFWLSRNAALRVEYRHYFYPAEKAPVGTGGVSMPAELSLGISWLTGGPE